MFISKGFEGKVIREASYQGKGYSRNWIRRGSIAGPAMRNNAQTTAPGIGKNTLVRQYIDEPVPPRKAAAVIQKRLKKKLKEFLVNKPDGYVGKDVIPADAGSPVFKKKKKIKTEARLFEFMKGQGQAVYTTSFAAAPATNGTKAFFPRSDTIAPNSLVRKSPDKPISPRKAAVMINKRLRRLGNKTGKSDD